MQQTTFLTVEQGQALAQAVINLSNGLLMVDREGHATAVTSAATAYADRVLRHKPSPAPAPSCDAPHCACVDGTDGPTVGAAETVQVGDCECHSGADCETPEICAHERAEAARKTEGFNPHKASSHDVRAAIKGLQKALGVRQDGYMGPATTQTLDRFLSGVWPFDVRPDAVNVLPPGMKVETAAPDIHARLDEIQVADVSRWVAVKETLAIHLSTTSSKLDGLKAAVDALAERLERKAGRLVRVVRPESTRVVSGQGIVWVVDTRHKLHRGSFAIGDLVARGDSDETMVVTGIASHGAGPLIGLTVRVEQEG